MQIFSLDIDGIIKEDDVKREVSVPYKKFNDYDLMVRYINNNKIDKFNALFILVESEISRDQVLEIVSLLSDRGIKSILVTKAEKENFKLREKLCKTIIVKEDSMKYYMKKIFIVIKQTVHKIIKGEKIIKQRLTPLPTDIKYDKIIGIGASSGGTETASKIYKGLPAEIPPMLMVQHMPKVFSRLFTERLNKECLFDVVEAIDGEIVRNNTLYIAPGGYQMSIVDGGSYYKIKIQDIGLVSNHSPSVDYLFNSMADLLKARCIAVILTGMGDDGAEGICRIRSKGGFTIGQDEESSLVYSMPRVAFEKGGICIQLSDAQIANYLKEKIFKKLI